MDGNWINQTVRFAEPLESGDAAETMTVIDDRGDRVLVISLTSCTDWRIRPTSAYLKSDLIRVESANG